MKKFIIKYFYIFLFAFLAFIVCYFIIPSFFNSKSQVNNYSDDIKLIIGLAALATGISAISTYSVFNAIVDKTKRDNIDVNNLYSKIQELNEKTIKIENELKLSEIQIKDLLNIEVNNFKEQIYIVENNIKKEFKDYYSAALFSKDKDFLIWKVLTEDIVSNEKYIALMEIDNLMHKNQQKKEDERINFTYLIQSLKNYYDRNKDKIEISNEKYFKFLNSIILKFDAEQQSD